LFSPLANPGDLDRELRKQNGQLPLKFLDGVINNVWLEHGPLQFCEQAILEPVGAFLQFV
jgi:hypothetical protein